MKAQLPVNLNLFEIKLPISALVSILHRISGFILFLLIPFLLWLLQGSLSPAGFDSLKHILALPMVKCVIWGSLSLFFYHVTAGLRHLCMDAHLLSENLCASKISAAVVLALTLLVVIVLGMEIWL